MSLDALKDLKNYNTNEPDLRADNMMTENLRSFAKMSKDSNDFENATQALMQVFNMVFTANFYNPPG